MKYTKEEKKKMKKEKKERLTFKKCASIKREDGLKMRCVARYTFPSFLDALVSRYSSRLYCDVFNEEDTTSLTYKQLSIKVKAVASYLYEKGFRKGDRIAIYGESCPNWMVFYLALTEIGMIAVPILPGFSASEAKNAFEHSEIKGLCCQRSQFNLVKDYVLEKKIALFRLEDLFHIPEEHFDTLSDAKAFESAPGFNTAGKAGKAVLPKVEVEEDDVASIIYTSGTTGASKGVVLTHKNILRNADWCTDKFVKINPGDRVLSILPMSHVYEFTIGQILTMMCGAEIHYLGKPPAVSILLPALRKVRPHIMLTVPLLIEKVYKSAVLPVLRDNKKVAALAKNPLTSRFVYKLVGKKLKMTFGGNLKFFGIGGAPLDPEVENFLYKAGFPYAPGYGLTETSPFIAGAGPKVRHPGAVGFLVSDLDVKLADVNSEGIGEILVKGPSVMSGYYRNDELNREAFTADGYFKTGDLGSFDKKHWLSIRGRSKTMILGPAGENIYPESIEYLINSQEFVEESLVVPENGTLLALIKIDFELMAKKMAISVEEAHAESQKYVASLKARLNKELSSQNRIDSVRLQEEPFDRTATHKIKRFLYPKKNNEKDKNVDKKD